MDMLPTSKKDCERYANEAKSAKRKTKHNALMSDAISKRRLFADFFVFSFIGLWIGFAFHAHLVVEVLHDMSESEDKTDHMRHIASSVRNSASVQAKIDTNTRRDVDDKLESGDVLHEALWQWTKLSGLFGDGNGESGSAPTVTDEMLEATTGNSVTNQDHSSNDKFRDSFREHHIEVLSRSPRLQLYHEFANPTLVNTALAEALKLSTMSGPTKADNKANIGLQSLKTYVVNATYYPSVLSSPWKIYRISAKQESYYEPFPHLQPTFKSVLDINDTTPKTGGEVIIPLEGVKMKVSDERNAVDNVRMGLKTTYEKRCNCEKAVQRKGEGLVVKTRPGDALLLYRGYPNNSVDMRALFGLCKVSSGPDLVVAVIDATLYDYETHHI